MCRTAFLKCHRQQIGAISIVDLLQHLCIEDLGMDRISDGAGHVVVNPARELLGAKPPVDVPFLMPDRSQGVCRYRADERLDMRRTECSEGALVMIPEIWIVWIDGCSHPQQNKCGIEVRLE